MEVDLAKVLKLKLKEVRGRVDFALLTVREDEFEAVLQRMPERRPVQGGYECTELEAEDGSRRCFVAGRQLVQAQGAAQAAASKMIRDLDPRWLVLVGIAGGAPDHEFSLGDVLLASYFHDFSVSAIAEGRKTTYQQGGGRVHQQVQHVLEALPGWRDRFDHWNLEESIGMAKPSVQVKPRLLYGSDGYRKQVRKTLLTHFPKSGPPRRPLFRVGPVATSNTLIKQTGVLKQWQRSARHLTHVEMEAGGAYEAAWAANRPLLCVRGISDIVGFTRDPEWTKFACHSAASFLMDLLRSSLIELPTRRPRIQPVSSEPLVQARTTPTLPSPPTYFGREIEVEAAVRALLATPPRPLPILGLAGVGKSTIATIALWKDGVAQRFGARRYFVRCDGATSPDGVVAEVARTIGVESGLNLEARVLNELSRAPAAVALDNFETPLASATMDCAALLDRLAKVPGLALLVTIRGESRPAGLRWPMMLFVLPLQPGEARQQFVKIAPKSKQDPDLDPLLEQLNGLPLAVDLVARAAERRPNLAELRTSLAAKGESRELNLAASLEVPMQRLDANAKRFLQLLARLPVGMAHADLKDAAEPWWREAASTLRKSGLTFDEVGRLRLLAPVREHVLANYPASVEIIVPVARYFADLTLQLAPKIGETVAGERAVRRLSAEVDNIEAMLVFGCQTAHPKYYIGAACEYAEFCRFTGEGSLAVLEQARQAAIHVGSLRDEAECLYALAKIALFRSNLDVATVQFQEASAKYRQLGDAIGEANCIYSMGNIAARRSDQEGAQIRFMEALGHYRQFGGLIGEANCIEQLAGLALSRSDYKEARERFEEALLKYRRVGNVLGEANCIEGMGEVLLDQAEYEAARARFDEALPRYRQIGDMLGEANCIKDLGRIAFYQADYVTARARFDEALPRYRQVGDLLGEANCIQGIGMISEKTSEPEVARARFSEALTLYAAIPEPFSVGEVHERLAKLALSRSVRQKHVQEARKAWTSIKRADRIQELDGEFGDLG